VELDFGGQWTQDMSVDADLALGKLTLHVPRDVGVRVEVQKFLASFDQQGLVKRGDAYYSDNWDQAKYRLRLRAQTTFGGIELDRAN
jgi:predicted membrane protein